MIIVKIRGLIFINVQEFRLSPEGIYVVKEDGTTSDDLVGPCAVFLAPNEWKDVYDWIFSQIANQRDSHHIVIDMLDSDVYRAGYEEFLRLHEGEEEVYYYQ